MLSVALTVINLDEKASIWTLLGLKAIMAWAITLDGWPLSERNIAIAAPRLRPFRHVKPPKAQDNNAKTEKRNKTATESPQPNEPQDRPFGRTKQKQVLLSANDYALYQETEHKPQRGDTL